MRQISFTIYGKPMGKQRARTLKNGISYTPKETVNYETLVKLTYADTENSIYFDGPVHMHVIAFFPIPKSASKLKRRQMILGEIRPIKKPDWDNIGKIVSDALNGVAYHDDSQITSCLVEKYYSDIPQVEVILRDSNKITTTQQGGE
jgi:Holliday junction resolvase RusA-like endonuclease